MMMAGADYANCTKCSGKAFYDANVDDQHYLAFIEPRDHDDVEPIDMAVLCSKCAKTHKCVVVEK